jgi:hypothetical protein
MIPRFVPPLLILLAGCASTPESGPARVGDARGQGGPVRTEAPDPGVLDQAAIPPGQCGMILWTRSGASAVPIFRSVDDGQASMVIEGEPVTLTLTGRGGENRLGIPAVQRFEGQVPAGQPGEGPVQVTVRAVWGQPFPAGAYVRDAALTVQGADGWSRIVPTAGIAGCKP